MAPVTFESEHSDEAVAIGELDRVVIIIWRGVPTRARLERATEGFGAISARRSGPMSMLAVVESGSPPPSLEDLGLSARAFDRFADVLTATAGVLEDRAAVSMMLDVIARVNALRRRPSPSKFCADVREAAAWLGARHPHEGTDQAFRDCLVGAVEELRARLP